MVDLVRIRKERGLTAKALSDMADVDATAISLFETGKRGLSVKNAKRIAAVLGFHWSLFFEDALQVSSLTE